ncbi:pyridoxamine 5'-phosphate oxidase family protein [Agromyces allii]|nr:pyridoxamine 5'-phosphate oxidase family protein [Agromyces allii]
MMSSDALTDLAPDAARTAPAAGETGRAAHVVQSAPAAQASAATTPVRRIRRLSERQVVDRAALDALLDEELVGHLTAVADGVPIVVPMGFARVGDHVLVHGSTGGGFALRAAAEKSTVAFAVTALDGLVYARSLFDSSMNYRSAVVYGVLETVDDDETDAALLALSERLMPGRPAEVRETIRKEVAATRVLRLRLDDVVMKVRAAGVSETPDDGEDHTVWAGVVPLTRTWGMPERSALTPVQTPTPESVVALTTRSAPDRRLP